VGIRHQVQGEPDPDWLCRADVLRGLAEVARAGLAYDLLVRPQQLPATIKAVDTLPELRFVLDHAGKPPIATGELGSWATSVAALARLENVSVKLSGLVTEADPESWTVADLRPVVDVLLDAFGPDRIMFGSDWPVRLPAATYDRVVSVAEELTADLNEGERAELFGGTAARWYRIGA
jgi:L-fuconolactonase